MAKGKGRYDPPPPSVLKCPWALFPDPSISEIFAQFPLKKKAMGR